MKIGVKEATEKGYAILEIPGFVNLSYPSSKSRRGRVQGGGVYVRLSQQRQKEYVKSWKLILKIIYTKTSESLS